MGFHAHERLAQRYDAGLSDADLAKLRRMVLRGQTEFLERGHSERSIRRAVLNGQTYRFVWSHRSNDIITFLPLEPKKKETP